MTKEEFMSIADSWAGESYLKGWNAGFQAGKSAAHEEDFARTKAKVIGENAAFRAGDVFDAILHQAPRAHEAANATPLVSPEGSRDER